MKKIIFFLGLASVFAGINSCKNDLDALAPYKESVVVYGLIDAADSVNYIRVNRVFLGPGDATQMAQIQDSVYFKPGEATVAVEKYFNGTLKQRIVFYETYEKPLQQGVFNANQLIYKTTQAFKADSAGKYFDYVLKVTNNKTGTVFESESINLIKNIAFAPSIACGTLGSDCFFSDPNSNVAISAQQTISGPAQTKVKVATPKHCMTASAKIQFFYTEFYASSQSAGKVFEYELGEQEAITANGGEVMDFTFKGVSFLNSLNAKVPDVSDLTDRLADSMNFVFYFGGEELQLYKEVNNTSGSFGQEKPIYTNMKNGAYGVFSSRTKFTVNKKMFVFGISGIQTDIITELFLNFLRDSNYPYCRMRIRGPGNSPFSGC